MWYRRLIMINHRSSTCVIIEYPTWQRPTVCYGIDGPMLIHFLDHKSLLKGFRVSSLQTELVITRGYLTEKDHRFSQPSPCEFRANCCVVSLQHQLAAAGPYHSELQQTSAIWEGRLGNALSIPNAGGAILPGKSQGETQVIPFFSPFHPV